MTNKSIHSAYLRQMLADELLGIRHLSQRCEIDRETIRWMLYTAHACYERVDQHMRRFGVEAIAGRTPGAFPFH